MFRKYPLITLSARNGLLGGVLGMVLFTALFFLGKHPMVIPLIVDYRIILFAVLLVFTLKEYRDYYGKGLLSFFEGMALSLVFTVAFSVLSFLVVVALGSWKPDFVSQYIALQTIQFNQYPAADIEKFGKDHFADLLSTLKQVKPLDLAYQYVIQTFSISFFLSLIISVVLRRQPKI